MKWEKILTASAQQWRIQWQLRVWYHSLNVEGTNSFIHHCLRAIRANVNTVEKANNKLILWKQFWLHRSWNQGAHFENTDVRGARDQWEVWGFTKALCKTWIFFVPANGYLRKVSSILTKFHNLCHWQWGFPSFHLPLFFIQGVSKAEVFS